MKIFRRILAVLVIMIMIPVTLFMSLVVAFTNTFFDPEFYESDVFRNVVYEQITQKLAESILEQNPEVQMNLTPEEVQTEIKNTISPDTIADIVESVSLQIQQNPLPEEIIISLVEFKRNLPSAIENLQTKTATLIEPTTINEIPDEFSIPTSKLGGSFKLLKKNIDQGYIALVVLFLAIIGLLIWKPLSTICGWLAATLAINGVIIMAWPNLLRQSLIQYQILGMDTESARILLEPLLAKMFTYGYIHIAFGGLFIVLYFFIKWKQNKENSVPSPSGS